AEAAFAFVESGRGLLLAEGLANTAALLGASLPPALAEDDASTRARVVTARQALLSAVGRAAADSDSVGRARAELAAAWVERERAAARVQRGARRIATVVYPQPMDANDLARRLAPDEAFVAYHLGSTDAAAVVVTAKGTRLVALGASEKVTHAAQGWRRLASAPGAADEAAAATLYDLLVRPLEGSLAGAVRLVVSPDGVLAFVPFPALLRRDGERSERLVERFETTLVPSATVYAEL